MWTGGHLGKYLERTLSKRHLRDETVIMHERHKSKVSSGSAEPIANQFLSLCPILYELHFVPVFCRKSPAACAHFDGIVKVEPRQVNNQRYTTAPVLFETRRINPVFQVNMMCW